MHNIITQFAAVLCSYSYSAVELHFAPNRKHEKRNHPMKM